ncbi:MAG: hypothetical protein JKX79_08665 [Labilibaculum sp.]|nr:hypothetical protein [Labilibaculum sp.]
MIINESEIKEDTKTDYLTYKEELIKNWKWSWDWSSLENIWHITNLKVHCPKCDTPMYETSFYDSNLSCPRCSHKTNSRQCGDSDNIKRIIIDNIDRKRN